MTAPSCPEAQHLLAFANGRVDERLREEVGRHLGTCASCRRSVDAAVDELRQAETRDVVPVPEKRPRRAPAAQAPPPQRVGRYLVLELLGAGGMGEVLLAYDPVLDRRVAVKLAHLHPDDDTQSLEARLRREAQSLARVVDPHVVAVHDAGNADGRPFVAMEYVPGATLKGWLKQPRTRAEVLRMFLGAARGLAAAHRVGVVHRDFKPDNVLVDAKGNARVTDFGLATLLEVSQEPRPSSGVDVSAEDTQQVFTSRNDVAVGTPGYMPPEQWEGRTTDARSDQFSFCVALHEGLVGERPFGRPTAHHSLPDFTGRPEAEKKRRELPAVLRVLLERGLALDPQARFPSMEPIIAALERALRPRRTGLAAAAVLVGVGLAGGTVAALRSPCHGALGRIEAVRRGVALSLPAPLAAQVNAAAARFEAAWASAWTDACAATHERREQPAEVLALRSECLSRQARRYQLVLEQLATARQAVRASALEALETGPRPDACLAVDALLSVDQPPPAQRPAIAALQERLLEARVLIDVGRYDDARAALSALEAQVKAAGFGPTGALHVYLQGYLAMREQRWRDARPLLRDGFTRAVAARDLELAARAGGESVFVSGYALGFLDEARLVADLTRGLVQRLDSRDLEARLENALGLTAMAQGQLDEARAHLEKARGLRVALLGAKHLETAKVVGNLGLLELKQGRLEEAEALLREDLGVREAVLGPAHPQVAVAQVNLSTLLSDRGRHDDAVALLQRALEVRLAVFGAAHPLVLATRADLALAFAAARRFDEARGIQLDVLAKAKAEHGDASVEVADALATLASTETASGEFVRALEYSQQALALHRKNLAPRDDAVMNEREREANLLVELHRYDEARARLEQLVREWRAAPEGQGPLASVLTTLGKALLLQRRAAQAVALLAEARKLVEPLDWHPSRLGEIEFLLAQSRFEAGQAAAARPHAEAAKAFYEEAGDTEEVGVVEVWMKAHR
ncbi:MAG: serine/threonine protein kinase [Myxococcales bacterium]|nr:serine/threonine protein kinase [Myxococcales bacterium]